MKNCTVNQFVMFAFNYPHNFIERAWAERGSHMTNHLSEKFSIAYERSGANGAMTLFYTMLDSSNQKVLENYISEYYSKDGAND